MNYGEIPGVQNPVARIIQGATMVGSDMDAKESFALLDDVYELGGNTIDTAHVYTGGNRERIIGGWMQSRGLREKIVLITKGAAHSEDRRRLTPFDIASDLYDSLARLKTDYIDLYLLHRDDPRIITNFGISISKIAKQKPTFEPGRLFPCKSLKPVAKNSLD